VRPRWWLQAARRTPLDAVDLLASFSNPPDYLAIGTNYRKNVEEAERHNIKVLKVGDGAR
jgi:hypothetical protein